MADVVLSKPVVAGRDRPVGGATPRRPRRQGLFAFLMVLPTLLIVFGVIGYPWVTSAYFSLTQYDIGVGTQLFIGLQNYANLLSDVTFLTSLKNTATYTIEGVILSTLLGLGIALVLNERFRGQGILRSVMLVPWALSGVVVGTMWLWILDGTYGTLNAFMFRSGITHQYIGFLGDSNLVLYLIGLVFVWNQTPLAALLFLAALQSVPPILYRSAKMDGASTLQRFGAITLPWLRSTFLVVLILQTINAVLTFELIYVMTSGGPGTATTLVSWLGYQTTFQFFQFGKGSAILYMLSVICLVLAYGYLRLLERPRSAGAGREGSIASAEAERLALLLPPTAMRWTPVALPKRRGISLLTPSAGRRLRRIIIYVAAVAIGLWSILPFLALLNWSFTPVVELLAKPAPLIPNPPSFENYYRAFFAPVSGGGKTLIDTGATGEAASQVARFTLVNSLEVSIAVTILGLVFGSLAAYAFSRYSRMRLMRGAFFGLMMTRMIPGLAMIVPWFVLFKAFGLLNTKFALIVTYTSFVVPLIVWVLKGYFDTIPRSVEQAALVDGCTRFQAFRRIALPLAVPGLVASCIFSFLVAWNEFIYAILLTGTIQAQTIQVTIGMLVGVVRYEVQYYGAMFAVVVIAIIPPVLIAFVLQRYLVQGMLSGSTKG